MAIDLYDETTWPAAALDAMRGWDREAGITPEAREASGCTWRDAAGDACNPGWDPEEWIAMLGKGDPAAILAGRKARGLSLLS